MPERTVVFKNMIWFYLQINSIKLIIPLNETEAQVPSLMTDLIPGLI